MDLLRDVAEFFKSFSITVGAPMALYALDAWRREFLGKRRMELVEEVLALF